MSPIELAALAASTSLLAGWRLYLVTLVTGLAMKFGYIALPHQLHSLDILTNNWVIGAAAVGTLAEFFADKIAWVDSAWDAVHSFIRPLGGALLSLAIIDSGNPTWQIVSFLLGGGAAAIAHADALQKSGGNNTQDGQHDSSAMVARARAALAQEGLPDEAED